MSTAGPSNHLSSSGMCSKSVGKIVAVRAFGGNDQSVSMTTGLLFRNAFFSAGVIPEYRLYL